MVERLYQTVSNLFFKILSDQFLAKTLTAAHCYARISSLNVIVGAHNIKVTESTQQIRPVLKWTNHEHYHSGNIQNDIALVEHGIFYENQFVRPIQVPAMQDDEWLHEGDRMRVCGWGTG